jgi:hypothetical protein
MNSTMNSPENANLFRSYCLTARKLSVTDKLKFAQELLGEPKLKDVFKKPEHLIQFFDASAVVSDQANDDEWINFISKGELPEVMKLTPKQLQALSGGGLKEHALKMTVMCVGKCIKEIGSALKVCIKELDELV